MLLSSNNRTKEVWEKLLIAEKKYRDFSINQIKELKQLKPLLFVLFVYLCLITYFNRY
jgi:hypothetical protein